MKKTIEQQARQDLFKIQPKLLNETAEEIIDLFVAIEKPNDSHASKDQYSLIVIDSTGKHRPISRKIGNLILNWPNLMINAGSRVLETLNSEWDLLTIIFVCLKFCVNLYCDITIELTIDHGLVYQSLWKEKNNNYIIAENTVNELSRKLSIANPDLNEKLIKEIINDLETIRSLRILPNGDIQLIESLEIGVFQSTPF